MIFQWQHDLRHSERDVRWVARLSHAAAFFLFLCPSLASQTLAERSHIPQGGGKKKGAEGGLGAAVSPHTQSALRRTLTRMETSLSGAQPNRWGASYPTQLKVRLNLRSCGGPLGLRRSKTVNNNWSVTLC